MSNNYILASYHPNNVLMTVMVDLLTINVRRYWSKAVIDPPCSYARTSWLQHRPADHSTTLFGCVSVGNKGIRWGAAVNGMLGIRIQCVKRRGTSKQSTNTPYRQTKTKTGGPECQTTAHFSCQWWSCRWQRSLSHKQGLKQR